MKKNMWSTLCDDILFFTESEESSIDSGNSTTHSPAEDKTSLMLTTSYATTEGNFAHG